MNIEQDPPLIGDGNNIVCLPLETLSVVDWLQLRQKGLNAPTVERYRTVIRGIERGGEPLPPITVVLLDGLYLVADGFHRKRAHEVEGRSRIDCVVREASSREEAAWIAAEGNLKHGLKFTARETREAFRALIRAGRHRHAGPAASEQQERQRPRPNVMTLGEIAAVVSVNKSSVSRWMQEDFKREYGLLYKQGRELGMEEVADHGEPYDQFRGETAAMVAKDALVNLTATLEHIKASEDLKALARGLAVAAARLTELHGGETLKGLIGEFDVGSDWLYTPIPPSDF